MPIGIKVLSAKQYSMCYKVPRATQIESARRALGTFSDTMCAIVGRQYRDIPEAKRMLPISFQATDGSFRVLNKKPIVVDTTKFSNVKKHNHQYAELLMFTPWFDEQLELGTACRDATSCNQMHSALSDDIDSIKEGCKKFLLDHS